MAVPTAGCERAREPGQDHCRAKLKYVVITSVDRDDLQDGGAGHFARCIQQVRARSPQTQIEILTPISVAAWTARSTF